jgi:hypothetical protein
MQVATIPTLAVELNTETTTAEANAIPTQVLGYTYTESNTEQTVRTYFEDIPIMAEVAWCESRFEHVNAETGQVKRGHINPKDIGVMQINEYYHQATANKLEVDIFSLEGNLEYARYLYEREGTRPWNASRPCWQESTLAMR